MNLPNASRMASLKRQNFKAEFVSVTKSTNKGSYLNEYLSYSLIRYRLLKSEII